MVVSSDDDKKRRNLKVIQFDKDKNSLVETVQPKETFDDVGGLEDVKKRIRMDFIMPIQSPEFFQAFGKKSGGSLLLYGPPGCGKTFLAKAIAGEINASFIHLELQAILSMYVGQSEHNLHDVFEKAREQKPCVLFIDELDALGGNRHRMSQHHDRMIVNQLLLELDGLQSFNEQVYIIGATNTPWYLDPALRRPGRFNSLIFIPPPSQDERELILTLKTKDKPQEKLDLSKVAKATSHFSGADLTQVVDDAVSKAIERSLEQGSLQPMSHADLLKAAKNRNPTTLEWFSTAKNYATFSDTNKDYQHVLDYMKAHGIR
ncbi:ATP-binding protein [Metabacillus indicus]|uniref:ATP-binding protein n=1 Tax=Metabacillus indicus TaxID=246786 RepID=UPI0004933AB9|nr:ATP-binding protein [Metabacillus indicus]KEZ47775.1 ATPase AAA [Metabacillus indicus LMG 22858]